ncbi:MAG TPA: D-alanine--D-alanine ligase family protein [Spirochaetota bacterium]|nr:D-alanine--D-alanine ligase family protein [Spirochaetota bacterium]HOL57629.1 D-alanine--D-alanine ligase family protein [Spirochaetota bacterium]HPP05158.1 D-alanine--D-alanine ligase family protein [Spirochaetota bacterium]
MKKNISVLIGGKSVEHDVSIITGLQIVENLDKDKYNIFVIYIDKDGEWYFSDKLKDLTTYKDWEKNKKKCKRIFPNLNKKDKSNILNKTDCAIIAMHGNYGEDGKIQGMLDIMEIPYSSSGVLGSSTAMDKIVMKKIFSGMGLPVLPYIWFNRDDWAKDQKELINKIHYTLDYPIFIKPANLGSSIGISMAKNEEELIKGIEIANKYDKRILIEKGVENSVEVNCSVIKIDNEIKTSALEEPVKWEKFLSFEDKYLRSNGKIKSGLENMSRIIPARISDEIKTQIEEYSKKVYRAIDCKGVVRIDYILNSERDKVYINEINTIPGSFSFYLWEPLGISFSKLLDIIIEESIKDFEDRKNNIYKFDSALMEKIKRFSGAKGTKF